MTGSFRTVVAALAAAMCVGMMLFQMALSLGAPMGGWAWGGQQEVLPPNLRIGSLISAALFLYGAVVVLERSGSMAGFRRPSLAHAGTWALAVLFFMSGIVNLFQAGSKEKLVMVPMAFTLSVLFFLVALGPSTPELRKPGENHPIPLDEETP